MDNPFSWDYLTTVPGPNEVFGPFAIVFLIVFITGLVVTLAIYNGWARRFFSDPVRYRMARRWAAYGLGIFAFGLFAFIIRWLQINPLTLGERIWLWLSWLAMLVWIAYMIYDYRAHYAEAKARYLEAQEKRRAYQPAPGSSTLAAKGIAASVPTTPRSRPTRRRRR